jgi:hypothetical protein
MWASYWAHTMNQSQESFSLDHIVHMHPPILEVLALLDVLQEDVFYTKPYGLIFLLLNITAYVVVFSSINCPLILFYLYCRMIFTFFQTPFYFL